MRRILVLSAMLASAVPFFWAIADACGDKFLKVGQSARFSRVYAAIYPAAILLYTPSGRAASAAMLDQKFQATLTRAGHGLQVARNEEQLSQTLRTVRFDLVLTDSSDVEAIKATAEQSAWKPTVLPVMY